MSQINLNQASKVLLDDGTLNAANASALGSQTRNVDVADLSMLYGDPVFTSFLIDASGSMQPYKDSVIAGQKEMLNILRKSKKCVKEDALYVVQYLFNDSVTALHPYALLSKDGNDDVVVLENSSTYEPNGNTALYKTLFNLLQDMIANIANAHSQKINCEFRIGVITDGEDNQGGIDTAQIKSIIQDLHSKNVLRSSVIIGLTNSKFTPQMLDELKGRLGFQQSISLGQDERAIRRAFVLASQSSLTEK